MAISTVKTVFHSDLQTVWDIVTSLEKYQWRSDLSRIEVISENQFIEYTKDGYATTFTVTDTVPLERWEVDMENSNMVGRWIGIFKDKGGKTEIDFTESLQMSGIFCLVSMGKMVWMLKPSCTRNGNKINIGEERRTHVSIDDNRG